MSAISLPKIKSSFYLWLCRASMRLPSVVHTYVVVGIQYSSSHFLREYTGTLAVLASLEAYRRGYIQLCSMGTMEACGFMPLLWWVEHNLDEKLPLNSICLICLLLTASRGFSSV